MVKIAKTPKNQMKQKKMAPPPKKVEESEEEESSELEESSGEEMIPQKKQQKVAVTPAKKAATPAKKAATPAKKAITPAKKPVVTPAKKAVVPSPKKAAVLTKGAKNGKNAKKEESEEEEEDDEEDEDDEDEEESDEDEEPPMPVKPAAKKPAAVPAKKPAVVIAKQESEEEDDEEDEEDEDDDESEDEAMDTTPVQVKKTTPAKAAPVKAKAESEDEEDEEDDEEDEDEEEEDEDDAEEESEDEKPVKEAPGKRKKEMANKSAPEAKKKKTEAKGPTSAFSVFVGNLSPNKEFEELKTGIREFFGKKNIEILDVRIGSSKRFGYVDFSSAEDLDKALQMNGKKLMGSEIKLEKAKSKETMKENKKERDARTLFVKNLPYRITEDEIREVFENATEVRIVMNKEGNSKGMAYIEFKTEAEANKALEEKRGTEIDGRTMVIDFTGEKSHQDHQKGGGESKTLIVNNLSYAASEETLQELFKKASSIKMPQNNQGRPKGYAFVEFPTAEDAKEALNSCNNTEIEGRPIRLEFSAPAWQKGTMNARGGFNQQSKTLFVRGLSEDTTEETLRESFEGSISARIVTDRDTGSSKGFGFVDFSSPEDAKAAKEAMEDGEIDGNKVILDFAKPKGEFQRGGGFGGGFGGRGGRGGGRGGRGGFGGRGGGRGFGGRGGGFRGGRGGGGDHKPQGKKIKFE
ncbi:nucleolin isoform X1 [Calypte anna]|uniref:nucleolin isoform X1 n=1 Tax=Calypte anna TaxID=9244 RepID=UPI0011C479A4|nr:nucleolin isoform X1 [Calypte anna]